METADKSRHIRIPENLDRWFETEAKRQGHSFNTLIKMALNHWKETRVTMYFPEEKDLNIGLKDVASDRRIIAGHEAKIEEFQTKADSATGPRKGSYLGHITKAKKNLDAMSGNLGYHLQWLKRFRPDLYVEAQEVK